MTRTDTTAWAAQLGTIRANKTAGRGWRRPAEALATQLREAGHLELSRILLQAVTLGGRPSQADRVHRALHQVGAGLADLELAAPRTAAPATVVPTRYAPDGITVLQPRAGELVTLLVQVDGRDLQALELTPELATHLLHGLLDHASRPRLDRR